MISIIAFILSLPLDMLSRLKGIETLDDSTWTVALGTLDMLSRLKGIETMPLYVA